MSRVKTGVSELDEMLHGGFMHGDAVMIAGSAGSGKTTLALQHLVNGINRFNERGVYLTFEQLPDQIYRDAENFGWNLKQMEDEEKLKIVCTSPDLLLGKNSTEDLLHDTFQEIQPHRIIVDSLSHLEMFVPKRDMRKETYRLIMSFKARAISSMLIWETPQYIGNTFSISDAGLSFLVDSIVLLKSVEIESSLRRVLGILKMRGSDHDKRLREFEITPQGIEVSSPLTHYEGLLTGTPRRSSLEAAANSWSQAFDKPKQKHST